MPASPCELPIDEIIFNLEAPAPTTSEDADSAAVIGQGRALAALAMGLGIHSKGYNIFIMGMPGTGRRTALLKALSGYTVPGNQLQDKAYVYDFARPFEPRALSFEAGKAREFKSAIHDLVEDVKRIVALHSESEAFKDRRGSVLSDVESGENRLLSAFEAEIAKSGFQIVQIANGDEQATDILPVRKGEPVSFETLQAEVASGAMPIEAWNELREHYYGYMDKMKELFDGLKKSRAQIERRVVELRKEMLEPLVKSQIEVLKVTYTDPRITAWLDSLCADMVEHLFFFSKDRLDQEQGARRRKSPALSRYGVNIIVDRFDTGKPPVIFENRPTLSNLVGMIDHNPNNPEEGRATYLQIRPGSILKASGGVLVLRAEDILQDEESWSYLKRVLQTGQLEIQCAPSPLNPVVGLKPEPIEVILKVVLIGGEQSYDLLYQADPDFSKLFKICAEFDSTMARTTEAESRYVAFVNQIIAKEKLRPLSGDGAAAILEYSVRQAEHRSKLSTRFSTIADLLRESDWLAGCDNKELLDAATIHKAIETRAWLHRLPEDAIQAMILSGDILVQLSGSVVGKANGLAVHDRGYYAFGMPVVVSARVAPGDGGVVNIEGESGLSGEIFDKAVLILSGYLRSRYARAFPLSITASVCFEQSYTEIDGDSATCVQLCVILSAISGIPLRQDLAITGSVNQMGFVQPVGGVSEKVEGFHTICAKSGLTGSQGVILPRRNIANLILSDQVEADVRAGRFHVYAIDTIDQALEILTGMNPGTENELGDFDADTVNGRVSRELRRMADVIHRYET